MRSSLPTSLGLLVAAGVVFLLQTIPLVGMVLMFALAMFWSVLLVNGGMIGIAVEALAGRVSRWWLVLPMAFYGGYWAAAEHDQRTLRALTASYVAANADVAIPFDSARQSLVFTSDGPGAWLTQNYALPVAYSVNSNFSEGNLSHRIMDDAVCTKVRETPALKAAFVNASFFYDQDTGTDRQIEKRFCDLSMPEQPTLPLLRVSRQEEKISERWLPVIRITTVVTEPDGRQFRLLGGLAAPLSRLPMPVMGCAPSSGANWNCEAGFWREAGTPILPGARYEQDAVILAPALGLKPVAIADRRGSDPTLVFAKIAAVEEATLARQLAKIDAMIANPFARDPEWQVGVVANNPEALASRADAIMTALERTAAAAANKRDEARASGRILAGLLAHLPRERFIEFGPRLLAVYAVADNKHWLWETEPLLRRLGDLGPVALPYLSTSLVNGAGIEALCRVGPDGRAVSEPGLLAIWNTSREVVDRDTRVATYVAMRRIGISPPALAEDKRNQFAELQADWADISPQSPPRVCAAYAEQQARYKEKQKARRRSSVQ